MESCSNRTVIASGTFENLDSGHRSTIREESVHQSRSAVIRDEQSAAGGAGGWLHDGDVIFAVDGRALRREPHRYILDQRSFNEKRLIEAAGLLGVHQLFAEIPGKAAGLVHWVDLVADRLGVPAGEA